MNERNGAGMLTYIPTSELYAHPDNPRKDLGDLTELAESIKANGILQNLTVVPGHIMTMDEYIVAAKAEGVTKSVAKEMYGRDNASVSTGYTVIIGHRRMAAAKKAGLKELPCVVVNMTAREQLSTMLTENMQRSDLTVYEQAQGFQMMLDMGDTVESIAEQSGFSTSTVRRRVKLLDLDKDKFIKAENRGATLKDYMELDKIEDHALKNRVLDAIGTANFKNELRSAIDEEKRQKKFDEWKTALAEFATQIERAGYISGNDGEEEFHEMDYVRGYGTWGYHSNTDIIRPDDADNVDYFFVVGRWQIDLYKDHQERVETEEDRRRKEATEKSDRLAAELEKITERHFSLRLEFISEYKKATKHIQEICRYAAASIAGNGSRWGNGVDFDVLTTLLDIDDDTDIKTIREMLFQNELDNPEYVLLACVYASEDDDTNGYFSRVWNPDKHVFDSSHKENKRLDRLYDFLISLGYEMSDEEKAMQDGSHELLN